jgi:Ca2+-binding EF-hand superfamily protein
MRNSRLMIAAAIALSAMANVAMAAPKGANPRTTGAAFGQGAAASATNGGAGASDPLFAILDTDGDGAISAKELHKAVAALKELDANHDGSITWEEIVAASGAAHQLQLGQDDSSAGAGGGGFGGGQSQAMGRFMQFDKNHDGKVTVDEVPATMRDMDQNHDGVIDARELEIAARRMGDRANGALSRALGGQPGPGTAGRMPSGNPAGGTGGPKSP